MCSLKERPISPVAGTLGAQQTQLAGNIAGSLPSPLSNNDSPMSTTQPSQNLLGQSGQSGVTSTVSQGQVFRTSQTQPGMPAHRYFIYYTYTYLNHQMIYQVFNKRCPHIPSQWYHLWLCALVVTWATLSSLASRWQRHLAITRARR